MEMIFFGENNFTDEEKEFAKRLMERRANELTRMCVIYHPNCGCPIDQFVVLDRFPMSEKIHSKCPNCEKGYMMEISDPIIFHLPLTETDYTLEELKNCVIADSPQKHLIDCYLRWV